MNAGDGVFNSIAVLFYYLFISQLILTFMLFVTGSRPTQDNFKTTTAIFKYIQSGICRRTPKKKTIFLYFGQLLAQFTMSEKPSRSIRSKIPRFQGPRKTSTKAVALHPRIDDLEQRGNTIVKPGCVINTSNADNHEKPSNDEDIPFEPDPQALNSILSNKGINCGAARASEMTPSSSVSLQVPVNRLSMWDSLNEFKENLRQYRETFQQWNASMKRDLKSQTPTGNCKQSATLTPRSGRTSPRPAQMSLTQSLELHKENIKIFREKMQNIDSDLQTPRPARNHLYSQFTPKQRQRGLTITACANSPAMPGHNYVRKAWSELKENRPPHAGMKKPGALSTSKINPSKLCAIDETSPAFSCTSKEDVCHSVKPVRRALHLVSDENEATERPASFNGWNKASKEYCNSVEHNQSAAVSSSMKDNRIQHSLYSCESGSFLGLSAPSGLVFKSPDIQVLRLMPVFLTPKSPFPSGVSNAVSATECTWSCQQTLCTPKLKTRERVKEAGHSFQSLQTAQTDSKSMADPLKFLSDNTQTQAVTSIGSAAEFLRTYKASQAAKTTLHLPLSSAGELSDWFNKLRLNSGPTLCTAVSSQSCVSVPKLWQGTTPPVLKTPISSTPLRVFHGKTIMSNTLSMSSAFSTSSMSIGCPKLAVTPLAQVSRALVRDPRSPATYLSSQPARGNEAVASCLKNSQFTRLDNTDGLSVNYAISTVKRLRWADSPSFGEDYED